MNIQTRKYKVIEKVMQLPEKQLNTELEMALDKSHEQVKEARVKPHSEVRKKYEKWLYK